MKILVSDKLSQAGVEILKKQEDFTVDVKTGLPKEELLDIIPEYDALIVRSATKVTTDVIEKGENLRVIARAGVGLDNVDVEAATRRGILVMNAPGGNTISTAEHAISLLLALSRNIPQADASVKSGKWERGKFMGTEVYGKTLGIIGLGRVGTEVGRRAKGLQMEVIAYDPYLTQEKSQRLQIEKVELDDLVARSDYITFHVPANDSTRRMVNDDLVAKMKDGVRIINTARGEIIDDEALLRGIESGKIAGAALDVYEVEPIPADHPFISNSKIITTPHLGASTREAQESVALDTANQVVEALKNGVARNAVNLPVIDASALEQLRPHVDLGERLGLFQAQFAHGAPKELSVEYSGDIVGLDLRMVTTAILKGFLQIPYGRRVTMVNAPMLAQEMGLRVVESKSGTPTDYTNLIEVRVVTDQQEREVSGSILARNAPRLVSIDHYRVSMEPAGVILVCFNNDKPGFIGDLGMTLGKHSINIGGMAMGRLEAGEKAVAILTVDQDPSDEVMQELSKLKNLIELQKVKI